jgi:hypothetical protein
VLPVPPQSPYFTMRSGEESGAPLALGSDQRVVYTMAMPFLAAIGGFMNSRKLSAALAVAIVLALPAAAGAQTRRAPPSGAAPASYSSGVDSGLRFGGLVGFDFVDGETGLRLRVDGEMPLTRLAPNVTLEGVLSLGFTHFGKSQTANFVTAETSSNVFDLIPAARFTFAMTPKFALYGDAGLGFYHISSSAKMSDSFSGTTWEASTSGSGAVLRFAPGVYYLVDNRMRLGLELGLNLHMGDWSQDSVTLMGAFTYRI